MRNDPDVQTCARSARHRRYMMFHNVASDSNKEAHLDLQIPNWIVGVLALYGLVGLVATVLVVRFGYKVIQRFRGKSCQR